MVPVIQKHSNIEIMFLAENTRHLLVQIVDYLRENKINAILNDEGNMLSDDFSFIVNGKLVFDLMSLDFDQIDDVTIFTISFGG